VYGMVIVCITINSLKSQKNKYNVLVLMLYCKTLFAAIEVWYG